MKLQVYSYAGAMFGAGPGTVETIDGQGRKVTGRYYHVERCTECHHPLYENRCSAGCVGNQRNAESEKP